MSVTSYYHGGTPGLRVGDFLLPPSKTGFKNSAASLQSEFGASHVRDDRVYLTTRGEIAAMFAAMFPLDRGGWIYEVVPIGAVEPDPDYGGGDGESVQVVSARITRVVGPMRDSDVDRVRRELLGDIHPAAQEGTKT